MFSAAARLLAGALASLSGWAAVDPAPRLPPSRPAPATVPIVVAPLTLKKMGGLDYISLVDAARRLDLKLTTVERGRKITLTGPATKAEL